ncbi:MAG: ribosome biogenesis GTP-binding protein YsxC [Chitinivibrionales bacterium]|nr:ribosome biogenesis GTP-binding protein YsxC [Chitinivibrionales bacterium]
MENKKAKRADHIRTPETKRGIVQLDDGTAFNYGNAQFRSSFARLSDIPKAECMEFCVMGRSNVGKSSFINHVLENKTLARVSKTPGKTQCANLFRINESMQWFDLPGYGYAKTSHSERSRLLQLVHEFCEERQGLSGVILLLDIRQCDSTIDREVHTWLRTCKRPVFCVLTKGDKLSRGQQVQQAQNALRLYNLPDAPLVYSTHENRCRSTFWLAFLDWAATAGTLTGWR